MLTSVLLQNQSSVARLSSVIEESVRKDSEKVKQIIVADFKIQSSLQLI
jgi:low affinity Fe/Cu permease